VVIDLDRSGSRNVKGDLLSLLNELNEWLSQRMANRQLLEDIGVSLREIRNNQGVGHYSLNDLARDDPGLVYFICSHGGVATFADSRLDYVLQNLIGALPGVRIRLADR
jgi:hypothetical protein